MHRPSRIAESLLLAIALGGLALTLALYYPGITTPDTDYQFMQAHSFVFSDGHPPILTLFWGLLIKLKDGPALLMLSFVLLYWSSFWLLARALVRSSPGAASLLLLFAFSPVLLNYAGAIWKDVFVFDMFLLCFAITFAHLASAKPMSGPAFAAVVALIVIGSLGRYNSILSGLPLVLLAQYARQGTQPPSLAAGLRLAVKGSVLYFGLLLFAYYAIKLITKPTPMSPSSMLFVFDLIGMSLKTHQYLLPPSKSYNLDSLQACYDPAGWDRVWLSCTPLLDEMRGGGIWEHLSGYWLPAVSAHPMAYLQHRMGHFGALFTPSWQVFVTDLSPLGKEYGFSKGRLFLAFEHAMAALRASPLTRVFLSNGFWIVFNFLLFVFSAARLLKAYTTRNIAASLLLMSGFLYSSPLLLVGIAPDFRYVYWSIGTCLVGLAIYAARPDSHARASTPGRAGAAGHATVSKH